MYDNDDITIYRKKTNKTHDFRSHVTVRGVVRVQQSCDLRVRAARVGKRKLNPCAARVDFRLNRTAAAVKL